MGSLFKVGSSQEAASGNSSSVGTPFETVGTLDFGKFDLSASLIVELQHAISGH